MATYYARNKERLKQRGRDYMRLRRKNAPSKVLDSKLKAMFGISLADYNSMLITQNGVCAVCRLQETETRLGKVRRLCVDHDHGTGKVRGLLCSYCNLAIGYLLDDPLRARAVAEYLERHSG